MPNPYEFKQADFNNLEIVRSIVLARLKHDKSWIVFDYSWAEREQKYVTFEPSNLQSHFVVLATEVMWQLLIQGVITAGFNSSNLTLPHFRITDYGHKVLAAERLIPHDPTGYMAEFCRSGGSLVTQVTKTYLEEALRCFTTGSHVASVLLLGVAAECIFNELCGVVRSNLLAPSEAYCLDPDKHVKTRHRFVLKKITDLSPQTRRSISESLETTIISLYDLIRMQRNELGHPQDSPPSISREQAYVYFRLLPTYVEDSMKLATYSATNKL